MFAYVVALFLNNRSVKQYTGVKFNYELTYVRPCLAAMLMGVTLFAIMVGVIVYVILIFMFKAITLAEVETMPGGTKLVKILKRFVK